MFFDFFGILFSLSELNLFHSYNCGLLIVILIFVFLCYIFLFFCFFYQKLLLSYVWVEFFSSLIPIFILLFQVFPSLVFLWKSTYFFNDFFLTVKVTGHQWYWSYELSDFLGFEFDSYIKISDVLFLGDFNFLEVDNRLFLPVGFDVRFILTSGDVIHSWALPSFFLKLDCISGLMTVFDYNFFLLGIFYGQCSEICGVNHSFIPVVVELTLFEFFKNFLFF